MSLLARGENIWLGDLTEAELINPLFFNPQSHTLLMRQSKLSDPIIKRVSFYDSGSDAKER